MKIPAQLLIPFLVCGTAIADTILIDWSAAVKVPDPASDGKYWNSLGADAEDLATTALVNVNNNATGVSVTVDVNFTVNQGKEGSAFGQNAINGPSGADPFDETGATTDGIFANRNELGTSAITFTGLNPSTEYSFSAIGGRGDGKGGDGLIKVLQGESRANSYTLQNDGTILNFAVASTSSGTIRFEFREAKDDINTSHGDSATWNALAITRGKHLDSTSSKGEVFTDWIGGFTGLNGSTAVDADPDGDGIVNGIENYFGTHPGKPSPGLVINDIESDRFTFTHPLNPAPATDLTAGYRWSKDNTNFYESGETHQGTTVIFSQGALSQGTVTVTGAIEGEAIEQLFVDVALRRN